MTRKSVLLLTLAVVLGAVGLLAWSFDRRPAVTVIYGDATRGPINREVLTSGTLQPAREVDAGAQVSGTLQTVNADFNDRVKAGDVIAEIDPSIFDLQVAQAHAEVIKADADAEARQVVLDDATVKVKRARELRQQDLLTQAELDTAELGAREAAAGLTSAKAAARASRAALAQAQLDRSHTVIRAPIDGVVVNRSAEVGQTLASRLETPVLFRIADLRKMQMLTDVSEAEVGSVRPGADVTFQIESLGQQQFHGTVAEVRLQPVYESGATGTSGPTPPAGTVGTTGTAAVATSGTSSTAGSTSNTQQPRAPTSTSTSPSSTAAASQSASTAVTPPVGAVVSYTAIVDVDNSDQRIAPGTTAIVTLPTAHRRDVLRVPNNALSFHPSPAVLEATGQRSLKIPDQRSDANADPAKGRVAYLWRFENGKLTPVEVRTGVADETWTEILSGSVQPGDRFVTAATRRP